MIAWVDRRMVQWGEWMAGVGTYGPGGPAYPAYQMVHTRGTACAVLPCDSDVLQIDQVMAHVKAERPELYETAYSRYVQGLSNKLIAGRMRCHPDTVYSRLDFLHRFIEKRLARKVAA